MPKMTIAEFRARLTTCSDESALLRAYRELAQRPGLAMMGPGDWTPWPNVATVAARA